MHAINTNWSMSNLESRISAGTTVSIIFTKKTCSWSEKFRLRGKFPNVVSTSILFDCWRLLVEKIFSMLNQNRNFRVTILNPERSIKYDRFKIRAFADRQNYQKYLFFYLGWCPWTPKERFFEKTFVVKVVNGHIIYFNIVFPKMPLKDNMLRFYHFQQA